MPCFGPLLRPLFGSLFWRGSCPCLRRITPALRAWRESAACLVWVALRPLFGPLFGRFWVFLGVLGCFVRAVFGPALVCVPVFFRPASPFAVPVFWLLVCSGFWPVSVRLSLFWCFCVSFLVVRFLAGICVLIMCFGQYVLCLRFGVLGLLWLLLGSCCLILSRYRISAVPVYYLSLFWGVFFCVLLCFIIIYNSVSGRRSGAVLVRVRGRYIGVACLVVCLCAGVWVALSLCFLVPILSLFGVFGVFGTPCFRSEVCQ